MAVLTDNRVMERAMYRVKTAGTKLNQDEMSTLEKHCRDRNTTPGELIRRLILAEMSTDLEDPLPEPGLTEIVGVRLMLTNLLKPLVTGQKLTPEMFDGVMAEVKKRKRAVAIEARQEAERA
jgi:hypothetical protein